VTAHDYQAKLNGVLYSHVYRDLASEKIFIDNEDYQAFVNFLNEYLSDKNVDDSKKIFTIRGHTYQGVPRLPKNFSKQIELLAYKLEPNRFDFLIRENVPGTTQKFIRAVSTRYALYYNKKHHRTGSLFKDTYKLERISDPALLPGLIRSLHSNFSKKDGVPDHAYSSCPEYLGQRASNWINSQAILSNEGLGDQKLYPEKGKPETGVRVTRYRPRSKARVPEIILSIAILAMLIAQSILRIETSSTSKASYSPPSYATVLGDKREATEDENIKTVEVNQGKVLIDTVDNLESVDIYRDALLSSLKIGEAKDNDIFELVSESPGWYQVKLINGSTGYVSSEYSEIITNY